MPMPEAAVDEQNGMKPGKNQIRFSRQPAIVQAVPKTKSMEAPPYKQFRLRVSAFDCSHIPTACCVVVDVSQALAPVLRPARVVVMISTVQHAVS